MKRRDLIAGLGAISMTDWLGYFRRYGVPGTKKSWGIAEAVAQAVTPRFLIYWFQEGGWDSYSMFSPVDTRNDSPLTIPAGTLNPTPSWSSQIYRPINYGSAIQHTPKTSGNISYGFLAQQGVSLFPEMAVMSTHLGNTFHSGGRWEYHYGRYQNYAAMTAQRGADERTVLQAFCEAYGANYAIPHVSWHRWLSDGELEEANYPDGTGYYERLGPAYAHTVYGKTPADMRARLSQVGSVTAGARTARIRQFADNLHQNFLADKNGESVAAFSSAVAMYKQLTSSTGVVVNPNTLFTDASLRSEFGVTAADEQTDSTSVNGNPARSKDCPNTNVQALMTYELMTKGLSIGFWIESREIRGFDSHRSRQNIMDNNGQHDQLNDMNRNLWTPLKTLVTKLKNTPYGTTGKSYWDLTNIVLASEMGRTIQQDVAEILNSADSDSVKYTKIMDQDSCQHWRVGSVAFLGGNVVGNRQYGKIGTTTLEGIPTMPDGSLDPAYNPQTGVLMGTKSPSSIISDAGHVYSTALALCGLNPTGKGRNNRPPLNYIVKP